MLNFNLSKITVSGDIHLNMRSNISENNAWERERFLLLFTEFAGNDSNIIILNGDIFDKAKPTFLEIGVFYEGIQKLKDKTVYIVEGNHEELSTKSTTFDFLPEAGFSRIKADCLSFPHVYLWLVGHPYISNIEKDLLPIMYDKKNILISHYRSDIGYAKEEVDNSIVSSRFDDAVLSDIHYRLFPADNIQYTSSPYGIHFTPDKDYGYCTIDATKPNYKIDFIKLDLPCKVKLTVKADTLKDTVKQLDKANRYNLEVLGEATTDNLSQISDRSEVSKFTFSGLGGEESVKDITDDMKVLANSTLEDIIMQSIADVDFTEKQFSRAKTILSEVL